MNQNTKQKRSAASWLAELAKGRYGEYALSVPYGAAGRCLLAYSVFHHHPAYHRTGKQARRSFPAA